MNGKRKVVLLNQQEHTIIAKIINPKKVVLIKRITLSPSDIKISFIWCRIQFHIKLSFTKTFNKSQGQTLQKTRIYLPKHMFMHGQRLFLSSALKNDLKENQKNTLSPIFRCTLYTDYKHCLLKNSVNIFGVHNNIFSRF